MSTLVGMSDKEIIALADAQHLLRTLYTLTGEERQKEIVETLEALLNRASPRWGLSSETRPGQILLQMIQDILPPEEEDEPANSG